MQLNSQKGLTGCLVMALKQQKSCNVLHKKVLLSCPDLCILNNACVYITVIFANNIIINCCET